MSNLSEKPIVFPDRDRDRSYIGRFSEVISQVMMKTSDGSTINIDLENLGQIQVIPWSSEDEPGAMFGTAEDRTVFSPLSAHDVMVLELMAEHARKFKQAVGEPSSAGQDAHPVLMTAKVAG